MSEHTHVVESQHVPAPMRSVFSEVIARYVFNFRCSPQLAERELPAPLRPDLVDGRAVLSFCPYVLRRLRTVRGRSAFGFATVFAAPRIAAIHRGQRVAWVPTRFATSRLVASRAPTHLGTPRFEHIHAQFPKNRRHGRLEIATAETADTFVAGLAPPAFANGGSQLFATTADFVQFFSCDRAWSPAHGRDERAHVQIDLRAIGTHYAPLGISEISWSPRSWANDGTKPIETEFDSAFIGIGGEYQWSVGSPIC